jgi:hypothetical protein
MQGCYSALVPAAFSLLLTLGVVSTAQADNGISTTISGYGTVGGTMTSDGNYAYIHDPTEFTGATHQFDLGLDSRIGAQAVIDFGSGFSVTVQELARQRGSEKFDLGTEWAFVQYSPDPDWKFRLGRVALATYLFSDSREVGYAAPWFRAPNELYGSESLQYLDGAEALWHHNFGPVGLGLTGSYGNTQETVQIVHENVAELEVANVKTAYNIAATLEFGDLLFRLAQTKLHVPTTIPLTATYTVNYTLEDTFNSAALQFDNGKAIVLSEYAKRSENNVPVIGMQTEASKEWYVAGGWRFGKLTPLLMYGSFDPQKTLVYPQTANYGTFSASLRYDVVRNLALKAQFSRAQAANESYWVASNPTSSERVNVYSVGADFVF